MRFGWPTVPGTKAALNQWPSEDLQFGVPGFRALASSYVNRMDALAHRLLPLMARALGLAPDYFQDAFQGTGHSLRLSHYPDAAEPRMGVGAHTDSGILTLLAQGSKPGLELCLPNGRWVRPQTMPGSILVNSGDLLRRWTNHSWLSTLHRVVNIPGQERYAIPFFWNPRHDFVMEALPGCSSPENPPRYGPTTLTDYMEGWYAGRYTTLRSLTPAQVRAAKEGLTPGGVGGSNSKL